MSDQEVAIRIRALSDALENLVNALRPYSENELTGRTRCRFCDKFQGWWVRADPDWIPSHESGCPVGRAVEVLEKYG